MTVARAIRTVSTLGVLLALGVSAALADSVSESDAEAPQSHSTMIPDIRGDDLPTKVEKGHFVIVPIPMSNPTLGSGLVVGAAYFYPQSAAQQQVQPASVTGAAVMYTSNDSYAFGIGHESYWAQDKWRFTGAIGYANLDLELLSPDESGSGVNVDWLVKGEFAYAKIARRVRGNWYAGVFGRYVSMNQDLEVTGPSRCPAGSYIPRTGR